MYLELFNGRHSPDEILDDWGFEGPIIGPIDFVHTTYGLTVKISLRSSQDGVSIFSTVKECLLVFGAYYGDWTVFTSLSDYRIKQVRYERSKEVFDTHKKNLPLLINAKEEWVKIYADWRLYHGGD